MSKLPDAVELVVLPCADGVWQVGICVLWPGPDADIIDEALSEETFATEADAWAFAWVTQANMLADGVPTVEVIT